MAERSEFGIHLVHIGPGPSYGGDFNFAARRDVEKRGDVGETVGIGNGVVVGFVIDGDGKVESVLARKCLGVREAVLTNA